MEKDRKARDREPVRAAANAKAEKAPGVPAVARAAGREKVGAAKGVPAREIEAGALEETADQE